MRITETQLRRIVREEAATLAEMPRAARVGPAEPIDTYAYKNLRAQYPRLLAAVLASPVRDAFLADFIKKEESAGYSGEGFTRGAVYLLMDYAEQVV
jgi:hypothetical protein